MLRSLQRIMLSRYCFLSMAFFVPNVLMSAVVVVGRGDSSAAVVAAMCAAIVPLLLGCVAGQLRLVVASGADNSSGALLGVVAVIQNVSFFAQAAILAACACVE